MSKREKRLEKIRQNPKNVRFEDLEIILLDLGFTKKHKSSSHAIFSRGDDPPITIPYRKPFIKPIYIKLVLEYMDGLEGLNEDEED